LKPAVRAQSSSPRRFATHHVKLIALVVISSPAARRGVAERERDRERLDEQQRPAGVEHAVHALQRAHRVAQVLQQRAAGDEREAGGRERLLRAQTFRTTFTAVP
jgi:hypothetical protein